MNFQEFNLKSMVDSPHILIVGKRGSGKSILARDILNSCKDKVSNGIVISPNEKQNKIYSSFIPELFLYDKLENETIEKVLLEQKTMELKSKETNEKLNKALVVMDDCLHTKKNWQKEPAIAELLFNGRHYQIMNILIMQMPYNLSPELRCNLDYIFLLADESIENQKRFYEHYGGIFPNFKSFQQIFNQLTKNYGAMVIVNRGIKTDIYEKIFHYKVKKYVIENINCDINIGDDEIVI